MFNIKKLSCALLLASSTMTMTMAVQAAQNTTNTVTGRAPVASSVTATNTSVPVEVRPVQSRVGHQLTAGYSFSDPDGDSESGTVYQWLRNGSPISGATSATYTATAADNGANVSIMITPKTSAATTAPDTGSAVASPALAVTAGAVEIGGFLAPDTVVRTWGDADSYCRTRGARLPTVYDLQHLYINATIATSVGGSSNKQMCELYGWPLYYACEGLSENYWSSSSNGTYNYIVRMTSGRETVVDGSTAANVTCVR